MSVHLSDAQARSLVATFRTVDKALDDVERACVGASSALQPVQNDLGDDRSARLAASARAIRASLGEALAALGVACASLPLTTSQRADTSLLFASIALEDVLGGRGAMTDDDVAAVDTTVARIRGAIDSLRHAVGTATL